LSLNAMLDRARFPRASEYFESLPKGFDSFEKCRVRVLVFEPIGKEYPSLAAGLPPGPLAALLRGELQSNSWTPEVVGQVANLMVRDACLASDAEYYDWSYRASQSAFDKPLIRSLMRLFSPTLLVMGAARRWSTLHDGTQLDATPVIESGDRWQTIGRLRFPEGVFPQLFLEGLTAAFSAAMEMARGRDIKVELADRTIVSADYRVSWAA
jgi:hypothetical protein